MTMDILFPEEVKTAAREKAALDYEQLRMLRTRDIMFKEILVEYIAATRKLPEEITAAELVAWSNKRLDTPLMAALHRAEGFVADNDL